MTIDKKLLRASRDWVGGQWVDVERNPEVLSILSAALSLESKLSVSSAFSKEAKSDGSPMSCLKVPSDIKLSVVYETETQQKDWPNGNQKPVVTDEDAENTAKHDDNDLKINGDSSDPKNVNVESLLTDNNLVDKSDNSDEDNKSAELEAARQEC